MTAIIGRAAAVLAWTALCGSAHANERALLEAISERHAGNLSRSIELLAPVRESADPQLAARAAGEAGVAYLQARRLDEAEAALRVATAALQGAQRAPYEIELGNLAARRKNLDDARAHYREAIARGGADPALAFTARLNLARIGPDADRPERLAALAQDLPAIADKATRARLHLNLGNLAGEVAMAHRHFDAALRLANEAGDGRAHAEALDALARLYEDAGRHQEALALARDAWQRARELSPGRAADLLIDIEWRMGRLAARAGDSDLALASYQRAVESIERVRQDIPIEYDDGRSSFQATLEPVYLGLADLLLRKAGALPEGQRDQYLARVRDLVELTRQAEMQDYLRDRCEVEAIQRGPRGSLGAGVGVLYPVVFPDRIELLLETDAGIAWRTTPVSARVLRLTALGFAGDLRAHSQGFMSGAQALHRWLLAPLDDVFRERAIDTLIVVSAGALRLVPMNALHDGRQFAVERFAFATATGLTMTNIEPPAGSARAALVAGVSVPGAVVDKLPPSLVESILGVRSADRSAGRAADLRERLALPGVEAEVESISRIMKGRKMLNEAFTVARFQSEARTGDQRIVHIASHGVFGGSANASYIMAFDDVLTMDHLQALLRQERFRRNPIELLTLSACQTAEGDDRSPLGISGAAMKARAKSVLGTLWPVEDASATVVMEKFYENMARERLTKARALQRAQVEALRTPQHAHPFFWAPFVLIGNWL